MLDLGCGPGTDARLLASVGLKVRGVDLSPEMVAIARARGVEAEVGDLVDAEGPVDGLFSDFGALDCVDGEALGAMVRRLLPVGRWLVAVVMNRRCPVEDLALIGRGRRPFRRGPIVMLRGEPVVVQWWSPRRLVEVLGPGFRVVRAEALGVVVPPPDLGGAPGLRARLDGLLGPLPGFRTLGDHCLCEIRRVA